MLRSLKKALPREHGAWAMLFISLVLAQAVTQMVSFLSMAFWMVALGTFSLRRPVSAWYRGYFGGGTVDPIVSRWGMVFLGVATGFFSVLVYFRGKGFLVFALLAVMFFLLQLHWQEANLKRTWLAEVMGAAGIALAAPALFYVAKGHLGAYGICLWAVLLAHFTLGILHVRWRLRNPDSMEKAAFNMAAAWSVVALAVILGLGDVVPPLLFLAYLPAGVKALLALFSARGKVKVAMLGWTEVLYSLFFLFGAIYAYGKWA